MSKNPYDAGHHSDWKPEEAGLIISPDPRPVDPTIDIDSKEMVLLKKIADKLGVTY